ncbi:hypothetical protein Bca52824_083616 [Brassica carinata]|uniref:Uncharacterized protein n=1 Tax=Brassica carinata TaxID=52824 RepID=A0A8X7PLR0_BRACI|nr:hypothetical protein Bca52824_083616 [Brassica carinata]
MPSDKTHDPSSDRQYASASSTAMARDGSVLPINRSLHIFEPEPDTSQTIIPDNKPSSQLSSSVTTGTAPESLSNHSVTIRPVTVVVSISRKSGEENRKIPKPSHFGATSSSSMASDSAGDFPNDVQLVGGMDSVLHISTLSGHLLPSKELNIGGSLISAALEEACGISRSTMREMYNRLGDLGKDKSNAITVNVTLLSCADKRKSY